MRTFRSCGIRRFAEIVPAPVDIHIVPGIRQKHFEVFGHQPLAVILLHCLSLFVLRELFKMRRQIQLLSRFREKNHLRPYLIDEIRRHFPRLISAFVSDLDVPETAVSCNITQIAVLAVGGAEENALSRMRRDALPERGSVLVIAAGYKGFHLVKIRLFHSGKFSDLMYPVTLQFLGGRLVVHIRKRQAVRKPFHSEV